MRLPELPLEQLTPSSLWSALDPEIRELAAKAMYDDRDTRREADVAVAAALRFRDAAVRKLPLEQRVGYLLRAVRPDDALASSLRLALHLGHRRPLLSAFLDRLGIPQADGLIDPSHDLETFSAEDLAEPVAHLFANFPELDVELYLACLLAMDPDAWAGLVEIIRKRAG